MCPSVANESESESERERAQDRSRFLKNSGGFKTEFRTEPNRIHWQRGEPSSSRRRSVGRDLKQPSALLRKADGPAGLTSSTRSAYSWNFCVLLLCAAGLLVICTGMGAGTPPHRHGLSAHALNERNICAVLFGTVYPPSPLNVHLDTLRSVQSIAHTRTDINKQTHKCTHTYTHTSIGAKTHT